MGKSFLPAWGIIDRDLRKYFRSPALLIASLVLPLLQLVIIGYAFGGKIRGVQIALVDLDRGSEALRLREKFDAVEANSQTFQIQYTSDMERALQDTRDGRISATIVIPEGYSRKVNQRNRPRLGLVLDNTDPFVMSTLTQKMGELVEAVNQVEISPRRPEWVALDVVEIFPYVEYIQYLLPGSITLAIFLCVLIGGGLLYIDDKVRGIHEGYLVSPISKFQLVLGMQVSGMLKGAFAGIVVISVGGMIAGVGGTLRLVTILLLLLFSFLVSFSMISMVSLLMVRVEDPVIPRVVIGLLNTLLFFPSGAVYPISSFPRWLQIVAVFDPFTYAVHGYRSLLLRNAGAAAIFGDFVVLTALSLGCFSGVLLFFPRRL